MSGIKTRLATAREIDRYWAMFKPSLARVSGYRANHIERVVEAHRDLALGHYRRLHQDLKTTDVGFAEYARSLRFLTGLFETLSPDQQLNLHLAVILHDVAYVDDQDIGISHPATSASLIPGAIGDQAPEADIGRVQLIVGDHGLIADVGMHYLAADVRRFSRQQLEQLLLMVAADTAGKPGQNRLTPQVLKDYYAIFEGRANDPEWFARYRLQHLLGPSAYVRVSDRTTSTMLKILDLLLTSSEQDELKINLNYRLRNMCWPVFQELVQKEDGLLAFLRALQIINRQAAEYPDAVTIEICFEPDFFLLEPGSGLRQAPRQSLKAKLSSDDYLERTDLCRVEVVDPTGVCLTIIC